MSNGLIELPDWSEPDPDDARIESLVASLAREDGPADAAGSWPEGLWRLLVEAGATRWALPQAYGGQVCSRPLLFERYARLASGSLTAVFLLSQHDAAVRRLSDAASREGARRWLDAIGSGQAFTTVGISQLTTSRRLGAQALLATETAAGTYRLRGAMPWVSGACRADVFVTGALLEDGRQMLIALPADRPGVTVQPAFELAALQASCTAEVTLNDVQVTESDILSSPSQEPSGQPGAVGTAGLGTSALALGQARAALAALVAMAEDRLDLNDPVDVLCETWAQSWSSLMACAHGEESLVSPSQVRAQANALALRTTQAYLTARRGSGFLRSEPAQRWARQALFFLVWSCPMPIAQAAIRNLAGLCPG
jgi:alkylation response protein AidB-like acyl-CoA dehydrogenase